MKVYDIVDQHEKELHIFFQSREVSPHFLLLIFDLEEFFSLQSCTMRNSFSSSERYEDDQLECICIRNQINEHPTSHPGAYSQSSEDEIVVEKYRTQIMFIVVGVAKSSLFERGIFGNQ